MKLQFHAKPTFVEQKKSVPKKGPKIHAFLAHAGVSSRRGAEELILKGNVKVNGAVIRNVAERVDIQRDTVEVKGKGVISAKSAQHEYWLVYKPAGYVSTLKDPEKRRTVLSLVPKEAGRVYPVGRLEVESEGLMLLTNDGDLAQKLTHPKFHINKTYEVMVSPLLSEKSKKRLEKGVMLNDGQTAPTQIRVVRDTPDRTVFQISMKEGRNRQVRRMCAVVGLQVHRLSRIELAGLYVEDLQGATCVPLTEQDIKSRMGLHL